MLKPSIMYVSNPKDPDGWLTPDFLLKSDRTRQSFERVVRSIEQIMSGGAQHGVRPDWEKIVPDWKMKIEITVVMFWFGHVRAVEKPRLVAEDARKFRKYLANFRSAIENLPIPLWRAFDISVSDSFESLTQEVSARLEQLDHICEMMIDDKRTASRADVIKNAVHDVKDLFEKLLGRKFRGNLRLEKIRKGATNVEKRNQQFESFDAYFVQAVISAMDPDVTPYQIRNALRSEGSQR